MDLFFVLSGFLIGGILYDARTRSSYFSTFYSRRFYRILPLYSIVLALFLIGLALRPKFPSPGYQAIFNRTLPVWTYFPFLQNFAMAWSQTLGPTWLSITWSLAIEEQFYILLPLAIRFLDRRAIIVLSLLAIAGAPLCRLGLALSGNPVVGPYVLLPCRADSLAWGVLLALACRHESAWRWLVAHRGHLYAGLFLFGCTLAYWTKYAVDANIWGVSYLAVFYSLLLLLVVVNPGPAERFLFGRGPLVSMGTLAYGIYLFHQGIAAIFHYALQGQPDFMTSRGLVAVVASCITVAAFTSISWKYFEQPLIRRAHSKYTYGSPVGTSADSLSVR